MDVWGLLFSAFKQTHTCIGVYLYYLTSWTKCDILKHGAIFSLKVPFYDFLGTCL